MKGGSVPAHVTDWNDAAAEDSAATGDHKTFCRQLDAISRKQGAKRRSVLAHVTEQSNAVDEESAPTGEQKGEFSVWLVLLVGRKHRARAAPVLRTGNNAKSG